MTTLREQVKAALKVAAKATPGEWVNDRELGAIFDSQGDPIRTGGILCAEEFRANAKHMANMNPAFTRQVLESWLVLERLVSLAEACFEGHEPVSGSALGRLHGALRAARGENHDLPKL